jgi:hypothetical protein
MDIESLRKNCPSLTPEQAAHLSQNLIGTFIMHTKIKDAFEKCRRIIELDRPGQLIVIIGPTNVGKTRMARALDELLILSRQKRGFQTWGSGYVRLPSPNLARFDRGETYTRSLEALEEPLIEKKMEYPPIEDGAISQKTIRRSRGGGPTHAALWTALVHRLQRGHQAMFFDEAGELAQSLKINKLIEAVNMFKELADVGGSCVVLICGPEFGPVLWQSGQLSARIKRVYVEPYFPKVSKDANTFCAILRQVERNYGEEFIEQGTLSARNASTVVHRTRGMLGLAADMIGTGVQLSLLSKGKPLSWDMLDAVVEERMLEIGPEIDLELKLWECFKDNQKRGEFWGMYASAGYDITSQKILPKVTAVQEEGRKVGVEPPSLDTKEHRKLRPAQRAKRVNLGAFDKPGAH